MSNIFNLNKKEAVINPKLTSKFYSKLWSLNYKIAYKSAIQKSMDEKRKTKIKKVKKHFPDDSTIGEGLIGKINETYGQVRGSRFYFKQEEKISKYKLEKELLITDFLARALAWQKSYERSPASNTETKIAQGAISAIDSFDKKILSAAKGAVEHARDWWFLYYLFSSFFISQTGFMLNLLLFPAEALHFLHLPSSYAAGFCAANRRAIGFVASQVKKIKNRKLFLLELQDSLNIKNILSRIQKKENEESQKVFKLKSH